MQTCTPGKLCKAGDLCQILIISSWAESLYERLLIALRNSCWHGDIFSPGFCLEEGSMKAGVSGDNHVMKALYHVIYYSMIFVSAKWSWCTRSHRMCRRSRIASVVHVWVVIYPGCQPRKQVGQVQTSTVGESRSD